MYQRAIRFNIIKNVQQPTISRVYPSNFSSSVSTHPHNKDPNLVDDIREPKSGLESPTSVDDRVNVGKSSTTSSYDKRNNGGDIGSLKSSRNNGGDIGSLKSSTTSSYARRNNGGHDIGSYVADSAKQGVVKALETGLEIGEVAKKTLDIVWDATKDTTHKLKDVVAGDEEEKNDVSRTNQSSDDSWKRTDYDLSKKYREGN